MLFRTKRIRVVERSEKSRVHQVGLFLIKKKFIKYDRLLKTSYLCLKNKKYDFMALISCSECGKQISDKAISCPNCGNPINQQIQQEEYLCCPNCLSRELHAEHKGFSGGKALAGALLTGGIGLLAGTIGSKDTQITCLKCGNKFNAGEGLIISNSSNETRIIELIKSGKRFIAIKTYQAAHSCGLKEAVEAVNAIMVKNNIPLPNTNGTGCSVFLLIGIGLTLGAIALI